MTKRKHRCIYGPYYEPDQFMRPPMTTEDLASGGNWVIRECLTCGLKEWQFDETGLILVQQEWQND